MVGTGHDYAPAKLLDGFLDALVIGGHPGLVKHRGGLLVDALDDRLAAQQGQRLARKACRGIAGWYDCNVFHS